ncbi:hypothetical protein [Ensifer sp. 4252]|uniref:hypothetical protein n=1 Tax=Ensifer sp. 4252 TaxID=3373915 RepID=UPI003D1A099B
MSLVKADQDQRHDRQPRLLCSLSDEWVAVSRHRRAKNLTDERLTATARSTTGMNDPVLPVSSIRAMLDFDYPVIWWMSDEGRKLTPQPKAKL